MLHKDVSAFTWLIYTKSLFPWKEENTSVAKFVAECIKVKAEIHEYICICYYIFMSINYRGFSASTGE